jgi:hypothetical protein
LSKILQRVKEVLDQSLVHKGIDLYMHQFGHLVDFQLFVSKGFLDERQQCLLVVLDVDELA